MRVPLKITLMAALLVAVSASSSWALIETYLPGGSKIAMKFINYDVGTLYNNLPGPGVYDSAYLGALPTADPGDGSAWKKLAPGAFGDDSWGIFRLTTIENLNYNALNPSTGPKTFWADGQGGLEITGIFWGEKDKKLQVYVDPLGAVTQYIWGDDLNFAFFEDNTPDFNEWAGPGNRNVGAPVGNLAWYNTATDGTCIWTGSSVAGISGVSPYEFLAQYTPSQGGYDKGKGDFYGNLGAVPYYDTGALNSLLWPGDQAADMIFAFTASAEDSHGWMLQSWDPVKTYVTPELSTSWLMLLGMVPVGMAWRRRKRS